jgi:hypothetical protein
VLARLRIDAPDEERRMAIGVYFHPQSLTAAQYDDAVSRLDAAGAGRPKGRLHHSCFGTDGTLMVFEVWDSQETFEEFGKTLMPILQEVGIAPGQPIVEPIHNIIG